ncbi:MAG: hypothetical protein WCF90_09170 [Methanomicrobiales archaeon]
MCATKLILEKFCSGSVIAESAMDPTESFTASSLTGSRSVHDNEPVLCSPLIVFKNKQIIYRGKPGPGNIMGKFQ